MANIESMTVSGPDFGHVIVTAHDESSLGDDEWERNYLSHVREIKAKGELDRAANIVFAEGKGPTSSQRAMGNAIFGGAKEYHFKVAVVTSSWMVRGAVTALSWFNPLIRAFAPEAWRDAFAHARLTERDHAQVLQAMRTLRERVGKVEVLDRCLAEIERS